MSGLDLFERIDRWARLRPDHLAHTSPSGRLTYADLAAGSQAVAAYVQSSVPDDGSPVVVLGHKEPEMLLGCLGSVLVGHPYVPIDVSAPQTRREQIIESAGARLVLTPQAIAEVVRRAQLAPSARAHLADNATYYVMFTSGSTGEPKGVRSRLAA